MTKIKIIVLSHYLFDEKMRDLHLNDDNVENENSAFISIIGTEECLKYWVRENDEHYFKNHPNVLNLEFDDIGEDVIYNGHYFKTMHIDQGEKSFEFIENMISSGKNTFYIHCKAGYSRSRAFGEFIYRYCMENDIEVDYEDRNDFTTMYNVWVFNVLNHVYCKKYMLKWYSEDNTDYIEEIKTPSIREINRH